MGPLSPSTCSRIKLPQKKKNTQTRAQTRMTSPKILTLEPVKSRMNLAIRNLTLTHLRLTAMKMTDRLHTGIRTKSPRPGSRRFGYLVGGRCQHLQLTLMSRTLTLKALTISSPLRTRGLSRGSITKQRWLSIREKLLEILRTIRSAWKVWGLVRRAMFPMRNSQVTTLIMQTKP